MIEGLEFLKSSRFWLVLTASTSAIMLGMAGAYIVSALYFPPLSGKPDPLYPTLAGLAIFFPVTVFIWLFYRRVDQAHSYPEEHKLRFELGLAAATAVVVIIEYLAVTRFLLDPVLGANAYQHFSFGFAFIFGAIFGRLAASAEWAAIMDSGDRERGP